jgi:hypothetical protein
MFTSIFGMTFGVSSVIAPIIGGAFTDSVYAWDLSHTLQFPTDFPQDMEMVLLSQPSHRSLYHRGHTTFLPCASASRHTRRNNRPYHPSGSPWGVFLHPLHCQPHSRS